ncbi:MAG: toll/interleukin-1 receptor domain-containing protein [Candidatus Omnitrophica bacterium]|nr:toll/interleukin-1 receptor domain-containing protein [Candidatus Omnitrophota bacterium]
MNLFISYSSKDKKVVDKIALKLKSFSDVKYWDGSKKLGEGAWAQITEWIESSDAVLVIITESAVKRGLAIGKEIGIAKTKNKKIIPFVSDKISGKETTFLEDIAYEKLDFDNPDEAIQTIDSHITKLFSERKKTLSSQQLAERIAKLPINKEDVQKQQLKQILAIAAIVVAIIILTKE